MKTIKIWLSGIWQDHRNYLAVATLAATGCEITFTLHGSNCKKPPESSCTLLSILIWQSTLISPVPIFLETTMTRSQAASPFAHLVGNQQKMDADLLPLLPILPCPCPVTPQFKVAGGLGSYHETFCQIKCKQMTCTVDMATKQPCTQRGSI